MDDIFARADEFETKKTTFKTRSERIIASREAKEIILSLNEIYKVDQKQEIMDQMKRITVLKRKIEKRLNL